MTKAKDRKAGFFFFIVDIISVNQFSDFVRFKKLQKHDKE